jgi:hypothetical protein
MSFIAVAVIGGVASVAGAAISSNAAGNAADTQAKAAADAAKLQNNSSMNALGLQAQQMAQSQSNIAPWLAAGTAGLQSLTSGLGLGTLAQTPGAPGVASQTAFDPYGGQRQALTDKIARMQKTLETVPATATLLRAEYQSQIARSQKELSSLPAAPSGSAGGAQSPWTVTGGQSVPPGSLMKSFTMADYQADPGAQFRQDETMRALNSTAAAKGGALSGGAVREAARYSSGLASQEYGNAWNRFQADQTNRYNRLAAIAGVGQTAANTLNQAGSSYANNAGNIGMSNAAATGELGLQAANARASGYVGAANSWNQALGNIGNLGINYAMNQFTQNQGGFTGTNGVKYPS